MLRAISSGCCVGDVVLVSSVSRVVVVRDIVLGVAVLGCGVEECCVESYSVGRYGVGGYYDEILYTKHVL